MTTVSTTLRALVGTLLVGAASSSFADGAVMQTMDVLGQSLTGGCMATARQVVSASGAKLVRTHNGIMASITMPTPAPGSYCYPPANPFQTVAPVPGTPEVFTGWFFFFDHPEDCAVPHACVPPPPGGPAPNDFTRAHGGVYNFAGHAISGDGTLNLVGFIDVGETQFAGPYALENPGGAEVHLAIAPHGVVVPELLPEQISTPVGSPPYWWVGLFDAPGAP